MIHGFLTQQGIDRAQDAIAAVGRDLATALSVS